MHREAESKMFRYGEYIYKVYAEKSFSRAAEKLFITQSSLSLTIKKAEEQIGTPIFNRATNPVSLTEFGAIYIEALEKVQNLSKDLWNVIYDINNLTRGRISIGAASCFINYLLPQVMFKYTSMHPNIKIELFDTSSTYLIKKLNDGSLDFLITHTPLDHTIYNRLLLGKYELMLAIPFNLVPDTIPKKAYISKKQILDFSFRKNPHKINLLDFNAVPFILLRSGNESRKLCDNLFIESSIVPNITIEVDQNSTAYTMCNNGMGATIVNDFIIREMPASKDTVFFRIDSKQISQYIFMYTRKNTTHTRAMEEFINVITNTIPVESLSPY